ncbi:hypothetical protein PENANT_c005G10067 [Penicillium antarcticum]|uniref:Uncharacterized protein n=1 Tax=Penicillium antarcticum TaxID=416450 RepID=A0A1V6QEJ6_9EURO|nr:uncharacterized protein N7508_007562 [Penicillium antarcticum]KAJ5297313.1 hypothetical protein N7508_007562 [Penicillium antarcticum]OQD87631.1 hypothetical protein PENANT_c005G10067 [Penicillium antarcticum]
MDSCLSLQVTLASQAPMIGAKEPPTIHITASVHNAADFPVTFLKWATPLDPQAGVLGIFEIWDTKTHQTIPAPVIKVSRKLPASRDDLVELLPRQTLQTTINLPTMNLDKDNEYAIRARGVWHAVWPTELVNITASQLEDTQGASRGEFLSNDSHVRIE